MYEYNNVCRDACMRKSNTCKPDRVEKASGVVAICVYFNKPAADHAIIMHMLFVHTHFYIVSSI